MLPVPMATSAGLCSIHEVMAMGGNKNILTEDTVGLDNSFITQLMCADTWVKVFH